MGLPLPRGRIRDATQVALRDASEQLIPSANSVLASWPDGSLRWLLLRFSARAKDRVTAHFGQSEATPAVVAAPGDSRITLIEQGQALRLETGALTMLLSRDGLIQELKAGEQTICAGTVLDLELRDAGVPRRYHAGPATRLQVESQSPLHADIRWQGPLSDADGQPGPLTYDLRMRVAAGSSRLRLWLTVVHAHPRKQPWEDLQPQCQVTDWRWGLRLAAAGARGGIRNGARAPTMRGIGLTESATER